MLHNRRNDMKPNGKFVPKIEHNVPLPKKMEQITFAGLVRKMKPKDSIWVPMSYKSAKVLSVAGSQLIGKGKWAMRQEKLGHRLWRIK